jgi:Fe-S cluster assembly protein SufD
MNGDLKLATVTGEFLSLFEKQREQLFSGSATPMNNLRQKAITAFEKTGFPGRKSEEYKYLDLEKLFKPELNHTFLPRKIDFDSKDMFRCDIPELDTDVLLVLNGFFLNGSGPLKRLPNGVIYGSLNAAAKELPQVFEKYYGTAATMEANTLTSLNTAFAQDGVFLYMPESTVLDKPLQIIHLLLAETPMLVQHRNLFILEKNSSADVIVCDHTLSSPEFLTNSVTEVFTGENASFDFTRIQNEHNQSVQLTNLFHHQEANSRVNSCYITLHGGVVRNNLEVKMQGEGAENSSAGLFLADMNQHVDNYTMIHHLKPNCLSNQLYKGILDNEATGAFNGKIHVWPDAQKTLAYQKNSNLLLTDTASMKSRPQLEIYADDVKCSHGATIGQLDEDALFYLRSRGIPEKESRHLMMYAFAHDVISHIKTPALRERIDELVDKRLRGELSRCNNCKMNCH